MADGNNRRDWRQSLEPYEMWTETTAAEDPETWNSLRYTLKDFLAQLERRDDIGLSRRKANMMTKNLREVTTVLRAMHMKGHARFRRFPRDKELGKKAECLPVSPCIVDTRYRRPSQSLDPAFKSPACPTAAEVVENMILTSFFSNLHSSHSSYQASSSHQLADHLVQIYNRSSGGCNDTSACTSCTRVGVLPLSPSQMYNHSYAGYGYGPASSATTAILVPFQLDPSHMRHRSYAEKSNVGAGTDPTSTKEVETLQLLHRLNDTLIPHGYQTLNSFPDSDPPNPAFVNVPILVSDQLARAKEEGRLRADGKQDNVIVIVTNLKGRQPFPRKKRIQKTSLNTIVVPAIRGRPDIPGDKYGWRKYGQRPIKGSGQSRSYYRCSIKTECPARKHVEKCSNDPTKLIVTYAGNHDENCGFTRAGRSVPPLVPRNLYDSKPITNFVA